MPKRKRTKTFNLSRARKKVARTAVDRSQNRAIRTLFKRTKKEKKWIDQTTESTVSNNWLAMFPRPFTYCVQGDNNDQRIGNKVNLHSLSIKGYISVDDTANVVRIAIVRYGRLASASVDLGEVFDNISSPSPQHLLAMKVRNGSQPYQVLYDKTFFLAGNTTANSSTGSVSQKPVNIFLNLNRGSAVSYPTDAATTPSNGYIYMVATSDSALSGPLLSMHSRLIFSG